MADGRDPPERPREVLRVPAFALYWTADTIGAFGATITTVAIQVLLINVLRTSDTEVGVVGAVRFLPYLLVGLFAGAFVDRWRRKPILVSTNLGRGALLLVIPVLWLTGDLAVWAVAVVLFVFGVLAVFGTAAEQAFLPSLVPRTSLVAANARMGQSVTVAETSGPVVGGGLVGWIGAPFAVLVDAVTYFVTAGLVARIRVEEPRRSRSTTLLPILREIGDGVRWTYRHRTLAPMAISTHAWFLANSAAVTVFALFALRGLGLSALLYGVVLALAGFGGLIGALLAPRAGRRLGEGGAILVGRALYPVAWALVALAPDGGTWAIGFVALAQAASGFGMGIEDPSELGYRQAITPGALLGRVVATMRSANRTMAVVGSLIGGVLAGQLGYRPTLWLVVGVFAVAVAIIAFSPVRGACANDDV